jgi:hypothetical protein
MKRLSYREEKEMRDEKREAKRERRQRNANRKNKNWFKVSEDLESMESAA